MDCTKNTTPRPETDHQHDDPPVTNCDLLGGPMRGTSRPVPDLTDSIVVTDGKARYQYFRVASDRFVYGTLLDSAFNGGGE